MCAGNGANRGLLCSAVGHSGVARPVAASPENRRRSISERTNQKMIGRNEGWYVHVVRFGSILYATGRAETTRECLVARERNEWNATFEGEADSSTRTHLYDFGARNAFQRGSSIDPR